MPILIQSESFWRFFYTLMGEINLWDDRSFQNKLLRSIEKDN